MQIPDGVLRGDVKDNAIVWIMYRLCWPISWTFWRLGFHQHMVTALSLTLAFGASIVLVSRSSPLAFGLLWLLSVALDFVDGPVSRLRNQSNRTALRLDHYADLTKIVVGVLGICVYFDQSAMWMLGFTSMAALLIFTALNHDLAATSQVAAGKHANNRGVGVVRHPFARSVILPVITIHGGTVLLLAIAPLSTTIATTVFGYILTVSVLMAFNTARHLRAKPR